MKIQVLVHPRNLCVSNIAPVNEGHAEPCQEVEVDLGIDLQVKEG